MARVVRASKVAEKKPKDVVFRLAVTPVPSDHDGWDRYQLEAFHFSLPIGGAPVVGFIEMQRSTGKIKFKET